MHPTRSFLLLASILSAASALGGADTAPSRTPLSDTLSAPPGLVTKATLSVREARDNNVYLQGVTAWADRGSQVTNLLLTLAADYTVAPSMQAALSYSADLNSYHSATSESFTRHTAGLKVTKRDGHLTQVFTGGLVAVDGSKIGPTYTGPGGAPALGGPERMLRRSQDVASAGYTATYTRGNLLLRTVATWKDQQYRTEQHATAGYQNFASRDEGVYGVDAGWKSSPTLTTYFGYRAGHQAQENLLGVVNNYSNRLSRVLVGFEGDFAPWCKASVQLGQDFREFTADAIALTDKKKSKFYSNSSLTFTPTKTDTVILGYIRFVQPAFTGRNAYEDLTAEVQYRHTLDTRWTLGGGARVVDGFYEIGSRRDSIYFYNVAIACRIDGNSSLALDYQFVNTATKVRNGIDTSGRTYSRDIFALTYKLGL
jgi:hypothetical protein